jgi:hypothetical protein
MRPPTRRAARVAIAVLLGVIAEGGTGRAAQDEPWLLGWGECAAVPPPQALVAGETLQLLEPGRTPRPATVRSVRAWTAPALDGAHADPCDRRFEHGFLDETIADRPQSLRHATVSTTAAVDPLDIGPYFAIRAAPGATVIGGVFTPVRGAALDRLTAAVRPALPSTWLRRSVLLHGRRFGPAAGHDVVELYAGLPTRDPQGAPGAIARIAIIRHFFVDGHLLAKEAYERASGVEERVETEPPTLTVDNWWHSDTEQTAAYHRRAPGADWERLVVDGGVEGISWRVVALRDGLPVRLRRYLYTSH